MQTKSWWKKLPLDEKIITILFFAGFIFLVSGLIMLLTIRINGVFTGFNVIYFNGVINTLTDSYGQGFDGNVFFLKVGTIFTVFLMPICSGCSIMWFVIKKFIIKK